MNGYDLSRAWFNFKFANPDIARAIHSEFYLYIVDFWNRVGQPDKIGLPTSVTMQMLGVGSYNTYKKVLQDLIDFGFIILISESKNQHQSKVIAISNYDKATDTPLDVAISISDNPTDNPTDKALTKQLTPYIEQLNNKTIKQSIYNFSSFWDLYDKKKDTSKCEVKWNKLSEVEKGLILDVVEKYVASTNDVKYRKNPLTWLNGKCWLDEIQEEKVVPIKKYSEW